VNDPTLVPLADLVRTRHASQKHTGAFVVAIDGAVSVGKSTTAELLAAMLAGPPAPLGVHVVSTDGFIFPNRVLAAHGLSMRKGFPESYDHDALEAFVASVRDGAAELRVPVYSHEVYDVVAQPEVFPVPDVLVIEGLHTMRLADIVDLSVYVDAAESDIVRWYTARFVELTVAGKGFYAQFSSLPSDAVVEIAHEVWRDINAPNLHDYILPNRDLADVVLTKGPDHAVTAVSLRDERGEREE
jgi:type I pantothenate kinase